MSDLDIHTLDYVSPWEDELDRANHRSRQELAQQRDESRRLSEQRRRLKEVERLKRNGRPVPPPFREQALGRPANMCDRHGVVNCKRC